VARGACVGVLDFFRPASDGFAEDEMDFLESAAGQVAMAVANARLHERTVKLSLTDALTGLHNRRSCCQRLAMELDRSERFAHTFAVAMVDIDHFKKVNDTHGHLAGDQVLRDLAALLLPMVRAEQTLARVGGEELAVLLSGTGLAGARAFAEKIRASIEAHAFGYEGARIPVTVSIGVAELSREDPGPDAFVRRADERLYAAKRSGRNRVEA
jgi:diguanylate cyclase (GGDEF)-like protein